MIFEEDILTLIPQKPPFVMVDKLLYSDDNITKTSFVVSADNVFTLNGRFSEAGLMENMAQTAAAGEGYMSRIEGRAIAIGYIGAVKNLEVTDLPKTDDELTTVIKIETRLLNVAIASGKVWCNEQVIAHCEMKIFTDK